MVTWSRVRRRPRGVRGAPPGSVAKGDTKMRLMHTRLPDFYQKVQDAGKRRRPETEVTVSGLELSDRQAGLAARRPGGG